MTGLVLEPRPDDKVLGVGRDVTFALAYYLRIELSPQELQGSRIRLVRIVKYADRSYALCTSIF